MMNNLYKFTVLALFYQVTTGYTIGRVNNTEEGVLFSEKLSEERQDNCSQNDNTKIILLGTITAVTILALLFLLRILCILSKTDIFKKCNKKVLEADNSSVTTSSKEGLLTLPSNGRRQDKIEFKNEKLQETSELQETIEKLQKELEKRKAQYKSEKLRKTSEELLKENEKLREASEKLQKENEKLQKELEKRKAQYKSGKLRETSELQETIEKLQKEIEHRKAQYKFDWKKAALFADWRREEFQDVIVTLDEATAHPALLLSEKGRQITCQEKSQDLPSSAQRFDFLPCVLGQPGLTSGRRFWEVKVEDTGSWDLGICRDNVTRKGRVTISPENGFWAIRFYKGEYWALTSPETPLPLRQKPRSVGIFLDYEDGEISFFNMTDGSHIFTFPKSVFYGVLRPLFRLWPSDPATLTIV